MGVRVTESIFIDWGTSNARAYRVNGAGEVVDRRITGLGIRNLGELGFRGAFDRLTDGWEVAAGARLPVLMSGMIGSRQGWVEAEYAPCPAGLAELAARLAPVPGVDRAWIVPGVCLPPEGGRRDVIRGEEVQVFGALATRGTGNANLCLPGTHSKWVRVRDGRLVDFATAMTGEVFDVMSRHSILGALMRSAEFDAGPFAAGLDRSAEARGLLNHLFSVRAEGLFGAVRPEGLRSYLSGILIGHEIRGLAGAPGADDADGGELLLVGASGLADIYARALEHLGLAHRVVDAEAATIRGLGAVWSRQGVS